MTGANNIVTEEIDRLEHLSDAAFNSVNRLFEELGEILEKKRLEMLTKNKNENSSTPSKSPSNDSEISSRITFSAYDCL